MNEQLYLKKIDETIETVIRKKSSGFNLEMLINYIINKINSYTISEDQSNALESIILVKYFFYEEINSKWVFKYSKNVLLLSNLKF